MSFGMIAVRALIRPLTSYLNFFLGTNILNAKHLALHLSQRKKKNLSALTKISLMGYTGIVIGSTLIVNSQLEMHLGIQCSGIIHSLEMNQVLAIMRKLGKVILHVKLSTRNTLLQKQGDSTVSKNLTWSTGDVTGRMRKRQRDLNVINLIQQMKSTGNVIGKMLDVQRWLETIAGIPASGLILVSWLVLDQIQQVLRTTIQLWIQQELQEESSVGETSKLQSLRVLLMFTHLN